MNQSYQQNVNNCYKFVLKLYQDTVQQVWESTSGETLPPAG